MSNFTFRLGESDDGKPVIVDLPTLIETRLFDLASSGGGKSYALRVLIEKTAGHVQWIVLDPEGEFSSLREQFDFLLVGKDGEVPADVRSAKLLARKIMETRASTIIDLYEYKEIRKAWAADFLTELMTLPKNLWSPVMVAIDEAHQFAPETVKGSANDPAARARSAVITLSDSGRKQSRGCVIATQRLSKLAADARAELRNNLIGLTVQDLDRDRAADILGIPKRDNTILRELDAGEFFAFGPAFVSHRGVFRMKVDKALTRHPKPGEGRLLAVPKASEAIQVLVAALGDLPAQAQEEAQTLERLQTENARLQRELHARPVLNIVETPEPRVEIQVVEVEKHVLNGELPKLELAMQDLRAFGEGLHTMNERIVSAVGDVAHALRAFETFQQQEGARNQQIVRAAQPTEHAPVLHAPARVKSAYAPSAADASAITPYMRDLLKTFAKRHPLPLTKSQLALLSKKGKKSSALDSALAAIRRMGLVTNSNEMELTDAGFAVLGADVPAPPQTFQDIVRLWREVLNEYERALFDALEESHRHGNRAGLTTDELSQRSGKSKTSSQFQSTVAMFIKNKIAVRHGERIVLHNPLGGN